MLLPKLFNELLLTNDPTKFEDYTHNALRLLGIHRAYKLPQFDQAGKADGFFTLGNLAVIYDCTLKSKYKEFKKQQIDNYCLQFTKGSLQINTNHMELVSNKQQQVWIITRGQSKILEHFGHTTIVKVKEISVEDLKKLFLDRLYDCKSITEDKLESLLINLGET